MRRKRHILAAVVTALLLALPPSPRLAAGAADQDAATEDDLRAAFLLNFARFVTWPGERPEAPAPLVIGIVENPGLASVLHRLVAGQTVRGRPLLVLSLKALPPPSPVHILYLATACQKPPSQWLSENAGAILTISGDPDFCRIGGMIALYAEGRRMRFEINPEALQRSGLRASSKLLALSKSGGGPR